MCSHYYRHTLVFFFVVVVVGRLYLGISYIYIYVCRPMIDIREVYTITMILYELSFVAVFFLGVGFLFFEKNCGLYFAVVKDDVFVRLCHCYVCY